MRHPWAIVPALVVSYMVAALLPVHAAEKPAAPARAEKAVPLLARLDVVVLRPAGARRLEASARLPAGLLARMMTGGELRLVQSAEVLTVTGVDSRILIGRKAPFVYYDAKAAQFQVQYIDTGVKLMMRAKVGQGDGLDLDASTDVAPFEEPGTKTTRTSSPPYPLVNLMASRLTVGGIRLGDGLVLLRARGPEASRVMALLGVTAAGDDLAVVLTLARP